jgi:hypothetical protein
MFISNILANKNLDMLFGLKTVSDYMAISPGCHNCHDLVQLFLKDMPPEQMLSVTPDWTVGTETDLWATAQFVASTDLRITERY